VIEGPGGARSAASAKHLPKGSRLAPRAAAMIAEEVRDQIIRRELKAGDGLASEATLGEEFGVSRPTLREALRILESESLIIVTRGVNGGVRVLAPTERKVAQYLGRYLQYERIPLADVHEAMMAIELPAVEHLAKERSTLDLATLQTQLEKERATGADWLPAISAGADFHRLLVERAGNRTLAVMHAMIEEIALTSGAWIGTHGGIDVVEEAEGWQSVHQRLVDLLADQSATEASSLWARHLRAKIRLLGNMRSSPKLGLERS
jgi:GntR family transcriptional regulator, transcriptional repressor for pyruvate dehydrogenase complex